jgi:hypothetical protein
MPGESSARPGASRPWATLWREIGRHPLVTYWKRASTRLRPRDRLRRTTPGPRSGGRPRASTRRRTSADSGDPDEPPRERGRPESPPSHGAPDAPAGAGALPPRLRHELREGALDGAWRRLVVERGHDPADVQAAMLEHVERDPRRWGAV